MNCTELDDALSHVSEWALNDTTGFVVAMACLSVASLILLVAGERFVRPGVSALAGIGAAIATFMASGLFATPWPCETRLATAGFSALAAAVLALCILRVGLFFLGGAAFGVFAHVLYEALPLKDVPPPFVILDRSGYYYLSILGFAIVGMAVSHYTRSHFLRIGTSILGAAGLALLIHLVGLRISGKPPSALLLLIVVGAGSVIGVVVQRYLKKRRERPRISKKEEERRKSYTSRSPSPPVGIPVAP